MVHQCDASSRPFHSPCSSAAKRRGRRCECRQAHAIGSPPLPAPEGKQFVVLVASQTPRSLPCLTERPVPPSAQLSLIPWDSPKWRTCLGPLLRGQPRQRESAFKATRASREEQKEDTKIASIVSPPRGSLRQWFHSKRIPKHH